MKREELEEELEMLGAGAIRMKGGPIDRILGAFDALREEIENLERECATLRCGIKNEENEKIRQTRRADEAERQLGNARIATRNRVAEIDRLQRGK